MAVRVLRNISIEMSGNPGVEVWGLCWGCRKVGVHC